MVCVVNTIIEEISINRRGRLRVSTLNWGGGGGVLNYLWYLKLRACLHACVFTRLYVCVRVFQGKTSNTANGIA